MTRQRRAHGPPRRSRGAVSEAAAEPGFFRRIGRALADLVSSGPDPALVEPEAARETAHASPLGDLIGQSLLQCRSNTLERIRRANDMTSREVLAAGNSLGEIVQRAQSQASSARRALAEFSGQNGEGVADLVERQTEMTKAHLESIRAMLSEQTSVAQKAIEACSDIAAIGSQVTKVAQRTRILSLNANVEAARLGERGAGIEVIASEMRRLTDEVNRANRQIEQMAQALLASLPKIVEHTQEMSGRAEGFAHELSKNANAVTSATHRLRAAVADTLASGDQESTLILRGSHEALSHLQFQDPTAQSLLIIDADLGRVTEYVQRVLEAAEVQHVPVESHAELELTAANAHRELNAGEVVALDGTSSADAGEVLLF